MSRLGREPIEADVDGFTHGGEGVARVDGKAVFVAGALPGERIRMQVTTDRKRWARADLLEVVVPAGDRVTPPCPHADTCGGCDLQHASVSGQLHLKTRVVREQLQRIGRLVDPPVQDCVAVGPALGYRTQARMHADDAGRLGFHRQGTNEVVPIDRCIVLTPGAQAIRDAVGDETGAADVALHATSTGDRAAILTAPASPPAVGTPGEPGADLMLAWRRGDEAPGEAATWTRGNGVVAAHVAGFDFEVTAGGFFQGNIAGAEALVRAVLEASEDVRAAGPPRRVWDLYAGVGLFALPLAATGAAVTAVEVVPDAVAHLEANAVRAGLGDRVRAIARDVATFVARPGPDRPDVVVVDPPRTGCGIEVMAALATLTRATIVYVACDPAALARDARVLAEAGWTLEAVRPFDLFPMTHHVEAVATFSSGR